MILIVLEKAEVVIADDSKLLRSQKCEFQFPSVIRLKSYVKLPYKKIVLNRRNILKRDKHKCAYCGRSDRPLTVDHIVPRSRGGTDSWENLITACLNCNNRKGDRTPRESEMNMLFEPYRPNYILFIKNMMGRISDTWKPYLFQS